MTHQSAICLWFNGNAEEAARFYTGIFPDSSIDNVNPAPSYWPGGSTGDTITVEFTLLGSAYLGLNGGPDQPFTDAVSVQIYTDTQEETDRYWNALIADGGEEVMCGWCKDKFSLRWQIVPRIMMEGLRHKDGEVRARVFAAMSEMVKFDHAAIQAALAGD